MASASADAASPDAVPGLGPVPTAAPPEALYVHIPFCLSVCPYCDFVVVAGSEARGPGNRIDEVVRAIRAELELRATAVDHAWGRPGAPGRPPLGSVYLGGGTPSLLPPAVVADLLALVRSRFGVAPDAEVTLEANPGPDDRGDLGEFVAAGVNRISLGAQALDDGTLGSLGRRHRASDVRDAVDEARAAGVGTLGLDLLYDVPGGTIDGWMATLEWAIELEPDHLSLYALTLDDPDAEGLTGPLGDHLPMRRGARRWRDLARSGQDEDRAAAMYHHAVHRLATAGYVGYEISNWARPGHESRHNRAYWTRRAYEAVGPGAHAFDGLRRRWNAAALDPYVAALLPGGRGRPTLPPGGEEALDARTAAFERVVLGLRMAAGIPAAAAVEAPLADAFGWALAAELLQVTIDDRIVLTTRGRLLSNELFERLV